MAHQRFIVAQFPVTNSGRIVLNKMVPSKAVGVRKAEKILGPLTAVRVAEMDGLQDVAGNKYMIFFGQEEVKLLASWLVHEIHKGTDNV